jgi:hypothetical protein
MPPACVNLCRSESEVCIGTSTSAFHIHSPSPGPGGLASQINQIKNKKVKRKSKSKKGMGEWCGWRLVLACGLLCLGLGCSLAVLRSGGSRRLACAPHTAQAPFPGEHARPQLRPPAAGAGTKEEVQIRQPRCRSGPPAADPSGPGAKLLDQTRTAPSPPQLPRGPRGRSVG